MATLTYEEISIRGIVQGVGFRPFIFRLANELGLIGEVGNSATEVFVTVAGPGPAIEEFVRRIAADAPPLARVDAIGRSPRPRPVAAPSGFRIVDSRTDTGVKTIVPPDAAVCADCVAEMEDPTNRRFGHPFITCTNCGPRFTIITALPYDRPATTMASFPMCGACKKEYTDPGDRRYHAQPIACPDCGPTLEFRRTTGETLKGDAIHLAAEAIRNGEVLAIKGIGGYHLACDALDSAAVQRLRDRKHRPEKPFAIMVPDIGWGRRIACLGINAADQLLAVQRPIVLAQAQKSSPIPDVVAPGNPLIGVMLPYAPIHHLLFGMGLGPLVMTSGNFAGEPIAYEDDDALARLSPLADAFLTHDRPISVPCDDSVVRIVDGELLPIRRARGFAPIPILMPHAKRSVLAVGGELKNTFCMVKNGTAWVGQHIGDMETLATLQAFEKSVRRFSSFYGVRSEFTAVDDHPGYATGRWARSHKGRSRLVTVQHHWAHVAAVMAEHELEPSTTVLGFSFDGTGFGADETIWGGEVLQANAFGFERVAGLKPVPLPGGDGAIRHPSRMAMAHLWAAGQEWSADLPPVADFDHQERSLLLAQLERGVGTIPCSSMGRLFDAVASLVGLRQQISYEAQAAIELEHLALAADVPADLAFGWDGSNFDPAPLVAAMVEKLRHHPGDSDTAARLAAGVHHAVAAVVCEAVEKVGRGQPIVLTGGCFQNGLLLRLTRDRLQAMGERVLTHRIVPPNDGGLSLGQAFVAAHPSPLKPSADPLPVRPKEYPCV
ncbi:MAG: carbamoyltransferase HypF [Acidimicrobiales bacterium]|nr:carbamoyltransferase HypF [Acidimicrobiales bacterium]